MVAVKYKIIQSTDPQVVVDKVNDELKDGWKPHGGVAISAWFQHGAVSSVDRFAQALVKE